MYHPGFGVQSKIRQHLQGYRKTAGTAANAVPSRCSTVWPVLGVIGGGKAAISIVRPMRDPIMTRYAILFALN